MIVLSIGIGEAYMVRLSTQYVYDPDVLNEG